MNDHAELPAGDVATAKATLDQLNLQVTAMRAVLVQLLQEEVRAEKRLDNDGTARLLQANEQLVIRDLELRAELDSSAGALDEVTRSAALDALTRLPNRTVLLDRLEHAIAGSKRHHKRVAVLFLDLNNFKHVNDTFGHAAGDRVLQDVATCLSGLVRETDTVSRYGGDEFLIVLAEVAEAADAGIIAGKVNAALRAANVADAHGSLVSASIGISIYPDDGEDAAALIARADAAMYQAKQHIAGGFAFHALPADGQPAASVATAQSAQEQLIAEHERRHAQLVEANEQLVLAALGFEALRDAADGARQLRADLLGSVVKELDNPNAPVRLAASLSGLGRAHEELLPRAVAMVERQMEHMARTVGALLEPVQGESLKLPGAHAIDVIALARAAAENCRDAIESRHQVLDLQLHARPVGVHGHPIQLAQVLNRLLRSATDYTPDGGRLGLHVQPLGANVQLLFSDDGMGFEPDALGIALEPFARDPRLPWDSDDSFGLGLTTARAVLEAHGGSVTASSAGSGRGSQFTVLLPIVPLPAAS